MSNWQEGVRAGCGEAETHHSMGVTGSRRVIRVQGSKGPMGHGPSPLASAEGFVAFGHSHFEF